MSVDAFVLPNAGQETDPTLFAIAFLDSADFDVSALKACANELGIGRTANAKKQHLAREIAYYIETNPASVGLVSSWLLRNKRTWVSFKLGTARDLPTLKDPKELVTSVGDSTWYGPQQDAIRGESWYVRPVFVPHWFRQSDDGSISETQIRWLCFARIARDTISLHWNGFTHSAGPVGSTAHNTQFAYWLYVPQFFQEIIAETKALVTEPNLHELVLYRLWERYRYNPNYKWIDRRIRAESSGVALSAHAGVYEEITVEGIRGLANTIRKSVEQELRAQFSSTLPEPERFDEIILRTLLREYGTLSYEFSLQDLRGQKILRSHFYFGMRSNSAAIDSFPHLKSYSTWHSDIEVLDFLIGHAEHRNDTDSELKQARLFK